MSERYISKAVIIVGDPAGKQRSTLYEETSFDLIKREGLMAYPAPTNDVMKRVNAVESWLLASRDGGPGLLIDRQRCPTLIRALSGGYRYGKTRNGQRKPNPDKNQYSHVMDAFQYACVTAHGGMSDMIANRMNRARRTDRPRITSASWT
jgi:hypothetical protein